jgi:hypothetical protein
MPDMQTALSTAISKMSIKDMSHVNNLLEAWADAEQDQTTMTQTFKPTNPIGAIKNNVTREVFDFVKHNPGTTRMNAVNKLEAKGFKKSSVSSLIAQFVRDDQFELRGGQLYPLTTEYRNLPQNGKKKLSKHKLAKKTAAVKAKAQPVVEEAPKEPAQLVRRPMPSFNAQDMVNRWSAYQAREIYQELKSIFGG